MHGKSGAQKTGNHLKDWPWSSWSHYAKGELGLIAIDSLEERTAREIRTLKKVKG